jgi:hypothetical protein
VCINFDDTSCSCNFIDTTALRNGYAAQGVTFTGPSSLGGAGVLNECGMFSVTGHSSPNFAAFNCGASFSDGGIPCGPETLHFDPPAYSVTVHVGDTYGGTTATMYAYNASDALVDSASVYAGSALTEIGVSGSGITRVELNTASTVWVFDDLCFVH